MIASQIEQYDVVRVSTQPQRLRHDVAGKEGVVVGWSDADEAGNRDYGVYFADLQEVVTVPGNNLQETGRRGSAEEIVTRKGLRRRSDNAKPGATVNENAVSFLMSYLAFGRADEEVWVGSELKRPARWIIVAPTKTAQNSPRKIESRPTVVKRPLPVK